MQQKAGSVTEGTTRLLETPERQAPFGQEFYEQHGSLAQSTSNIPQPAGTTSRNLEPIKKPTNWALLTAVTVAILALAALLFVTLNKQTVRTPQTPVVTRPDVPVIQPPAPPEAPRGLPHGRTINSAYLYPGAETTMEISDGTEGNVLQLQTKDEFDKVVDWYTQKLKPTNIVRMKEGNAILNGTDLTAIISTTGSGTSIMLTDSDDR